MKINIKTTNLELTPSIQAYLEEKINHLEKFLPNPTEELNKERHPSVEIWTELSKTTNHHHKGNIFKAEANLRLNGKLIRAEAEGPDLHLTIDKVRDEIQRDLRKYKTKETAEFRKGAKFLKKIKSMLPDSWFDQEM